MLAVHYSNITQKGKFGTIDSIKILSTELSNQLNQHNQTTLRTAAVSYKVPIGKEGGREFSVVLPPLLLLPPLVVWMI